MMQNNNKVFEALEKTGLNWTVNKLPLFANGEGHGSPLGFQDGQIIHEHNVLPSKSFGMYRNDNNEYLGTVGERYNVLQNSELEDVVVTLQERFGGEIRGGLLSGGKKVFLQLQLKNEAVANDTIKRYITALNSHDGSSSIGFGSSNTVVACSNTFYMAYKDVGRFRHTASAQERLEIASKEYQMTLLKDQTLMDNFKRMADHKIEKPIFENVMNRLFNVDIDSSTEKVGTRKLNVMKSFNNTLEKELDSHGDTLWGLFNAVTYQTNHIEGGSDDYNVMVGSGYRKNLATYNEIMKWVEDNSVKTFSYIK